MVKRLLGWPVLRQLSTGVLLGRGPAVSCPRTDAAGASTSTADRVVQSV